MAFFLRSLINGGNEVNKFTKVEVMSHGAFDFLAFLTSHRIDQAGSIIEGMMIVVAPAE